MKREGALVVKAFHGASYDAVVQRMRDAFVSVKSMKPKASRDRSSEIFLIGLRLKSA
jgi:23S rRNA (uridine2552-2'-O)-methyltransferase